MIFITNAESLKEKSERLKSLTEKDKIICLESRYISFGTDDVLFLKNLSASIDFINSESVGAFVVALEANNVPYETDIDIKQDTADKIKDIINEQRKSEARPKKDENKAEVKETPFGMPKPIETHIEADSVKEETVELANAEAPVKRKCGRQPGFKVNKDASKSKKEKKETVKEPSDDIVEDVFNDDVPAETPKKEEVTQKEAIPMPGIPEVPEKKKRGRKPGFKVKKKETEVNNASEEPAKESQTFSDAKDSAESVEVTIDEFCRNSKNTVLNKLSAADKKHIKDAIIKSYDYYVNFKLVLSTKLGKKITGEIWSDLEPLYNDVKKAIS